MLFMTRFLLLLSLLASLVATVLAEDEAGPLELPEKQQFHVYLLLGQSNMAGRGELDEQASLPHARVLKLDQNEDWVPAVDPLHFDKPAIAGVGPGSGFGPAMAEAAPDAVIGLVPCAVGGTPLQRWEPDGDLYVEALKRARRAARDGMLKGILWHQGESDAVREEDAGSYGDRLAKMIVGLRADLESPDLPFVAGELGEFIQVTRSPHAGTVNDAIRSMPEQVPHTAFVSARGLTAKADQIHFDAESARELGRRYAAAMQRVQDGNEP